jgi:hypothetical protein
MLFSNGMLPPQKVVSGRVTAECDADHILVFETCFFSRRIKSEAVSRRRITMRKITTIGASVMLMIVAGSVPGIAEPSPESPVVGFDSEMWSIERGRTVEMGGRECLTGIAHLQDVQFTNGYIEVDVWMADRRRSYPGLQFRREAPGEFEEIYLRPHRSPFYEDAVQYTPVFHGVSGWQLYNGEGFTAAAVIQSDQWVRLRLEVSGTQARLFLGDGKQPVLSIPYLQRGVTGGSIGVKDAVIGGACFSNFSYQKTDDLVFDPPPPIDDPPGVIVDWQLSPVFGAGEIDRDSLPAATDMAEFEWREVDADSTGLVDISRYVSRAGGGPGTVLARTVIHSEGDRLKKLLLGYSDRVTVFLNGEIVYSGDSSYRSRDSSFLGVVGSHDALYLRLKQGDNRLIMMVTDTMGGWGFVCRDGEAAFRDAGVIEGWRTPGNFRTPESIAFDPRRQAIYVSNFDAYNPSYGKGLQSVSKLTLDGEIVDLRWVTGLKNPTGLTMVGDRLFVVERPGLVEIDPSSGTIVARHAAPNPGFLNDAASDADGRIYISDSARNVILRWSDGGFEEWLSGGEIQRPNGLHVQGRRLLVGSNGDRRLKAVDLGSREVTTVARFGPGIIDGISSDANGDLLVSHNEGRVYRVSPNGEIKKLLDTTVLECFAADFEYVAENNLLLIPTFTDNRIMAYELKQ